MKLYVLGFLVDGNNNVALVRKKCGPGGQKGKLNGFGGHIEATPDGEIETPLQAMHREFLEESGWPGSPHWYSMREPIRGCGWAVHCFWTQHDFIYPFDGVEDVEVHPLVEVNGATVSGVLERLRMVRDALHLCEQLKGRRTHETRKSRLPTLSRPSWSDPGR